MLYAAGFVCFYPKALTNFDEVSYVRQAVSFASGSATVDAVDPFTGQHQRVHPSDYPAGTSTLMVPFVWLAGWRGAFLLGLAGVLGMHAVHGALDRRFRRLAALRARRARISARHGDGSHRHERSSERLPGGSRTVAVLGSDNQSTPWRRLAAGFLAGASICLREPNPVLFAFFFAGALLRRERHVVRADSRRFGGRRRAGL